MLIILIGPPGSGKGTQGALLASKLNLPHLSTGDMFRKIVASGALEGKLLREYMDSGQLVPTDLVNRIVEKSLKEKEYENGCVLDGYPRNVEQAKFLATVMNQPIKVIYFDVKDEVIIKRILGRFACADCAKNYNIHFDKPKITDICDDCGSSHFIHRKDDNEDIVKERIEVYNAETHPLIEYYQNQTGFYSIDASKNKEEIAGLLSDLLKRV